MGCAPEVVYLRLGKFLTGGTLFEEEMLREPHEWLRPPPPF